MLPLTPLSKPCAECGKSLVSPEYIIDRIKGDIPKHVDCAGFVPKTDLDTAEQTIKTLTTDRDEWKERAKEYEKGQFPLYAVLIALGMLLGAVGGHFLLSRNYDFVPKQPEPQQGRPIERPIRQR